MRRTRASMCSCAASAIAAVVRECENLWEGAAMEPLVAVAIAEFVGLCSARARSAFVSVGKAALKGELERDIEEMRESDSLCRTRSLGSLTGSLGDGGAPLT